MKIQSTFIFELFKGCCLNREILEQAIGYIEFSFLPSQETKKIWKEIKTYYEITDRNMSIGMLIEKFKSDTDTLKIIEKIKQQNEVSKENIFHQLDEFKKDSIFKNGFHEIYDLYNKGETRQAYDLFKKVSDRVNEVSTKKDSLYRIFSDSVSVYKEQKEKHEINKIEKSVKDYISSGIDEIDEKLFGGYRPGNLIGVMAPSGFGKSTYLRHIGVVNSRRGKTGVHFQLEDTREELINDYNSYLLGENNYIVETFQVSDEKINKLEESLKLISARGGEIYVEVADKFDQMSVMDVRNTCKTILEKEGKLDYVLVDYLELLDPGTGKRYSSANDGERKRRLDVANALKNLAIELNIVVVVLTQSSDIKDELRNGKNKNGERFVLTRNHISEFKGLVRPMNFFFTINISDDEFDSEECRIFGDKFRKYSSRNKVFTIKTNFSRGRFVDRRKTRELLIKKQTLRQ